MGSRKLKIKVQPPCWGILKSMYNQQFSSFHSG